MDFYDVEVDCMAYCYGGSPKFTVEPYGYGEWAKREDVDVLIAERDRLATETAELRRERDAWHRASAEWSEKCVRTECERDELKFNLAAANAALDALREAVPIDVTGWTTDEVVAAFFKTQHKLYPQPPETTDDEQ